MNEPALVPPTAHARMIEAVQQFLDVMEGMVIEHHGTEAISQMDPDARMRVIASIAVQAILQAGAWRQPSIDLDSLATAVGSALGCISAESNEQGSAQLVRALINGYTGGRMEGIQARMQFTTFGRAN